MIGKKLFVTILFILLLSSSVYAFSIKEFLHDFNDFFNEKVISNKIVEDVNKCEVKYLDEYKCSSDNIKLLRSYQKIDCSIIYVDYQYCEFGCSDVGCKEKVVSSPDVVKSSLGGIPITEQIIEDEVQIAQPVPLGYLTVATLEQDYLVGEQINLTDPPGDKKDGFFSGLIEKIKGIFIDKKKDVAGKTTQQSIVEVDGNVSFAKFSIKKDDKLPKYAPNELIIKFKEGIVNLPINSNKANVGEIIITDDGIARINSEAGVQTIERIFKIKSNDKNLNDIYKLKIVTNDIEKFIQKYQANPNVIYAEPNYISAVSVVPDDERYDEQWAHQNVFSEQGWDIEQGSNDVKIAIVDTGVDYTHEDLTSKVDAGYDFVDIDVISYQQMGWQLVPGEDYTIPDNDSMDVHGHGTHCSGIAAVATNNSIGVAGMCWKCRIMPVRIGFAMEFGGYIEGLMEMDDIVSGIVYAADNDADIISMSFGGLTPSNIEKEAIDYAYRRDVVLIAAAGNINFNVPSYPAAYLNVIAVAATNEDNKKSFFSAFGSWVDVAVPGSNILSTLPNNQYLSWSGTSMSTPLVAGVAGLILSHHPEFSNEQVKSVLTTAVFPPNSAYYIGTGILNVSAALQTNSVLVTMLNPFEDGYEYYNETVNITGTVYGRNFNHYVIKYGYGLYPDELIELMISNASVHNSQLALFDTTNMTDGLYTIKLEAYDVNNELTSDMNSLLVIHDLSKCYSCADCTYKTSISGNQIILQNDVIYAKNNLFGTLPGITGWYFGNCVWISGRSVTFDCNNHTIYGTDTFAEPLAGILVGPWWSRQSRSLVTNCNIMNFENSIRVLSAEDFTLSNNTLINGTYHGIEIWDSKNGFLKNNFISTADADQTIESGIKIWYLSDNIHIINNFILDTYIGIELNTANNTIIKFNNISSINGGLLLMDSFNTILKYNTFMNPLLPLFIFSDSNFLEIKNNIFIRSGNGYIINSLIPIELSTNNSGNYWGRSEYPYFCEYGNQNASCIDNWDSNSPDVIDSCPYSQPYLSGQWPVSPVCAPQLPPSLPKSMINNTGNTIIQGYLLMKIQKNVNGQWLDYQIVVNDLGTGNLRTIAPDSYLALDLIWNQYNVVINDGGTYRIYSALLDNNGNVINTMEVLLEDTYQFRVNSISVVPEVVEDIE